MRPPPFLLKIHPLDNVGVALRALMSGERWFGITTIDAVPGGHKVALTHIATGAPVIKYGYPIGVARIPIQPGEHVHTCNMASSLPGSIRQRESDSIARPIPISGSGGPSNDPKTFDGFRRPGGAVGVRNEIWIINTVGCVNQAASRIAARAAQEIVTPESAIEGIYTFTHPFGCSQLGDDLSSTQRLLGGLAEHPNAAAVLVLGLGCENNQISQFKERMGKNSCSRLRYFNAQDVSDEVDEGLRLVHELAEYARQFKREPIPLADLVLGMKCGGSDGLSGITANPLVGRIADKLAGAGGTSILSEVPEMFGAEDILLDRAMNENISQATVRLVNQFREYFRLHGEPIDENPSPGNKDGGITTLAEKSLGCVQKGGTSAIKEVLGYGQKATPGLGGVTLLNGPGNDGVSGSALSAAGAHMLLFTTGRGTPMGFPVPTIKISTNSSLAQRKSGWIDFDAGPFASGSATMDALADELFRHVVEVASGRVKTKSEVNGFREISIWKDGVTL